jgi:hypothetical protein
MKMFKTSKYNNPTFITVVDVISETPSFVIIQDPYLKDKTRREAKITEYSSYHHTWQEAYDYLLNFFNSKVVSAERNLEAQKGYLANFQQKCVNP